MRVSYVAKAIVQQYKAEAEAEAKAKAMTTKRKLDRKLNEKRQRLSIIMSMRQK